MTIELRQAETGLFIVEGTGDLVHWQPLATNRPIDGRLVFQDASATNHNSHSYRVVRPATP